MSKTTTSDSLIDLVLIVEGEKHECNIETKSKSYGYVEYQIYYLYTLVLDKYCDVCSECVIYNIEMETVFIKTCDSIRVCDNKQ